MLDRRRKRLEERQPLCIETTLATRTLLRFVAEAKTVGYYVRLVFLFTPFPDINELRVKQQVMSGGHNIDTDTVRRRHMLGLKYLMRYWEVCDDGIVFDARTRLPSEVVRKEKGTTRIVDDATWSLLLDRIEAAGGKAPDSG